MKETKNFFVIHNYNTDPSYLIPFCDDYVIYDQSDNPKILDAFPANKVITCKNTGHNLTSYFNYIANNYENLPDVIAFLKGNIVGRHITEEYWLDNYGNKYYTFLWNDPKFVDQPGIAYDLYSGHYLEINNSWYASKSTHRYFLTLNDLINFFYDNPKIPKFSLFSPGGCYIVEKSRLVRHPKSFYKGLSKILEYEFFPSEAWMVERLMNIIFDSDWKLKKYVYDENQLLEKIDQLSDKTNYHFSQSFNGKIKNSVLLNLINRLKKIEP